ncbi:MAG: transglutaminase family protein [Luteolibacter sp.]
MILDAVCKLTYQSSGDVPVIFMLRPRSGWAQWIMREDFHLYPQVAAVEFTDVYGNLCQRLMMPEGEFHVLVQVRANVPDTVDVDLHAPIIPVEQLPADAFHFLLPSRYCQSDLLGGLAGEIVGDSPRTYEQVEKIRSWIHGNIRYGYSTSNSSTSATDTVESRVGVCRDFAHLGIALCRSLTIPARMVVGFLHGLDPMDLHAWFEAFIGGRWYTFDATQSEPRGNRIVIAYGRDASDVALATIFGPFSLTEMSVTVVPTDFYK